MGDQKATLHPNGLMMYTVLVKHFVGREVIAVVIYDNWVSFNDGDPESKKEIWSAVKLYLEVEGRPSDGCWDEASEEAQKRSFELADKFFPELKPEVT